METTEMTQATETTETVAVVEKPFKATTIANMTDHVVKILGDTPDVTIRDTEVVTTKSGKVLVVNMTGAGVMGSPTRRFYLRDTRLPKIEDAGINVYAPKKLRKTDFYSLEFALSATALEVRKTERAERDQAARDATSMRLKESATLKRQAKSAEKAAKKAAAAEATAAALKDEQEKAAAMESAQPAIVPETVEEVHA